VTNTSTRRVLVTGGAGLLGRALAASHPSNATLDVTYHQTPIASPNAHHVDLLHEQAVHDLVSTLSPDLIIHTAYKTDDGLTNIVRMTRNVVSAAAQYDVGVIHLSTDLVFDGEHAPYGEDSPVSPITDYGSWKAEAEGIVSQTVEDATIEDVPLAVDFQMILGGEHISWV
jgi:dTDP-4-dehydrorhamnose reductase